MKNSNRGSIRFITYTAMGLALVILAQWLGNLLPAGAVIVGPFAVKQLITGSLVNCILFVFTVVAGLGSAVTIGILSSILATVLGVGPQVIPIVPLIALGNAVLSVVFWLCSKKFSLHNAAGIAAAAVCKCAFLWLTVAPLLSSLASVPEKQAKALSIMFSWPQGLTAICGGLLALIILPRLKKLPGKQD
ncbi:MAG: hypothetical protein MJ135_01910 [Oscillospiraceae bacterium]|nr:hypothetical protein [Oscillospiraceae bacterium]